MIAKMVQTAKQTVNASVDIQSAAFRSLSLIAAVAMTVPVGWGTVSGRGSSPIDLNQRFFALLDNQVSVLKNAERIGMDINLDHFYNQFLD